MKSVTFEKLLKNNMLNQVHKGIVKSNKISLQDNELLVLLHKLKQNVLVVF